MAIWDLIKFISRNAKGTADVVDNAIEKNNSQKPSIYSLYIVLSTADSVHPNDFRNLQNGHQIFIPEMAKSKRRSVCCRRIKKNESDEEHFVASHSSIVRDGRTEDIGEKFTQKHEDEAVRKLEMMYGNKDRYNRISQTRQQAIPNAYNADRNYMLENQTISNDYGDQIAQNDKIYRESYIENNDEEIKSTGCCGRKKKYKSEKENNIYSNAQDVGENGAGMLNEYAAPKRFSFTSIAENIDCKSMQTGKVLYEMGRENKYLNNRPVGTNCRYFQSGGNELKCRESCTKDVNVCTESNTRDQNPYKRIVNYEVGCKVDKTTQTCGISYFNFENNDCMCNNTYRDEFKKTERYENKTMSNRNLNLTEECKTERFSQTEETLPHERNERINYKNENRRTDMMDEGYCNRKENRSKEDKATQTGVISSQNKTEYENNISMADEDNEDVNRRTEMKCKLEHNGNDREIKNIHCFRDEAKRKIDKSSQTNKMSCEEKRQNEIEYKIDEKTDLAGRGNFSASEVCVTQKCNENAEYRIAATQNIHKILKIISEPQTDSTAISLLTDKQNENKADCENMSENIIEKSLKTGSHNGINEEQNNMLSVPSTVSLSIQINSNVNIPSNLDDINSKLGNNPLSPSTRNIEITDNRTDKNYHTPQVNSQSLSNECDDFAAYLSDRIFGFDNESRNFPVQDTDQRNNRFHEQNGWMCMPFSVPTNRNEKCYPSDTRTQSISYHPVVVPESINLYKTITPPPFCYFTSNCINHLAYG